MSDALLSWMVSHPLQGDLGDLGDGEFDEDELEGWEEYDSDDETNLWDSDDEDDEDDPDAGPVDMEIEKLVSHATGVRSCTTVSMVKEK